MGRGLHYQASSKSWAELLKEEAGRCRIGFVLEAVTGDVAVLACQANHAYEKHISISCRMVKRDKEYCGEEDLDLTQT